MGDFFELMLKSDIIIGELIATYGTLIYWILFLIIFIETGLVVVTFFPGDGLLFSAGIMAALGELNFSILVLLLSVATILGNTSNYLIGRFVGIRFLKKDKAKRNQYLEKSFIYYERNASTAIFASRFIPFFRSFVPFVAGITSMKFRIFTLYNILGGITWIVTYLLLGFFFGEIPWVKKNYGLIFSGMLIFFILGFLIKLFLPKVFIFFKKN